MQSLTVKELTNIVNTIVSKEREKEVSSALGTGGGEHVKKEELTPEMLKALKV